jgi:hypothetical protein
MSPESISTVASRRLRLIGLVADIAAIALAVYGVVDRARSKQEADWTNEQAIATSN